MIVEDDEDIATLLFVTFRIEGLRPTIAENGAAALRLARTRVPDVILLDLDMPVMSGMDTLRQVREDPLLCKTPVVMVTASTRPSTMQRAMALGADDYVTKPFDALSLVERVRGILGMNPAAREDRREAWLRQVDRARSARPAARPSLNDAETPAEL